MNVIKKYWDSVYIYILLIVPVLCICAGVFWTVCKLAGLYPKLSWTSIGIFDGSQLIYLGASLYFIYRNKKDGSYIQTHLSKVKLFICTILLIQYAFILVLFPSYEVWGCTFIFFAAIVFLFDTKITVISLSGYMVSLLLAHLLHPYEFLPIGKDNLGEMIAFRIVALSLTAICVVLVVHFAETFLMEATENNEENMSLLEQQVEHYKRIEVLDTELRKFRHDICNHFICMEAYLEQDKKQELQAYFKDLRQSFSFQERIYFSGNDIIDAVLNYQLSQELKEQVKVRVYGILPDKLAVSDMDLCTIFSNLLSNAIHSANQCVGERDSKLEIGFAAGKRYFSLIIANSICEKIEQPKRKERSRKNHGFGLYKIQEVLRKYDGRLMYEEVRDYIYEFNKENYLENQVVYFSKPSQLYEYMQMNAVNLIFMDLEFSKAKEDGILWSKKIKNEFPDTILIILTAYENRYKEGYEVRAWRFMTKPIVKQELFEYLQSGLEELRLSKSIAVQKRGIKRNILIKEIYYISAQSGGSELWMKSDMYYCDESLLQWEKQLPLEMFFRCHNKYLVNLCHVKEFNHQEITLVSGEKIPISRRKWKAFQIAFMKWDTKEYRR